MSFLLERQATVFMHLMRFVALGVVQGPEKPHPIAKEAGIHADRPPRPAADALLFGRSISVPSIDHCYSAQSTAADMHIW